MLRSTVESVWEFPELPDGRIVLEHASPFFFTSSDLFCERESIRAGAFPAVSEIFTTVLQDHPESVEQCDCCISQSQKCTHGSSSLGRSARLARGRAGASTPEAGAGAGAASGAAAAFAT